MVVAVDGGRDVDEALIGVALDWGAVHYLSRQRVSSGRGGGLGVGV